MKNKMSLYLIFSSSSPVRNHAITVVYLFLLSAPFAGAQSGNSPPDPYNLNPKFSPSMVITIIVLICAFFFMAFFSVYVRQCGERNGGSIRQAIRATGRSRRAPRGLDQDVIDTFPTFLYSVVKGLKIGKGTLECAVCLNEFEDDETLRLLPKCDHVFHPDCIDTWLASHTTCPVCRANLVPEPGEVAAGDSVIEIPDSAIESDEENRNELERGILRNQGSIRLIDSQNRDLGLPDVINPNQIPIQNRPGRSKSTGFRLSGKFPRSHSTGHSIVQPGDNCERFTLKLPEDVRKQIMNGKLHRTTSCVVFPTEASSRRGYRSGSVGSNRGKSYSFRRLDEPTARSDRWVFSRQPPFFTRTSSVRSSLRINPAEGESASTSKSLFTSVKTPFDCLGPKVDGADQSSPARPLV